MGEKLSGKLVLSRIPKKLVQKDDKGNAFIWVDVIKKRETGKYGDTHTITFYDKENRQTVYLCDLKPQTFGKSETAQPVQAAPQTQTGSGADSPEGEDDLPF